MGYLVRLHAFVSSALVTIALATGGAHGSAKPPGVPGYAVALPSVKLVKVTGGWCGEIKNRWVAGQRLRRRYFVSFEAKQRSLVRRIKAASGASRARLRKQARAVRAKRWRIQRSCPPSGVVDSGVEPEGLPGENPAGDVESNVSTFTDTIRADGVSSIGTRFTILIEPDDSGRPSGYARFLNEKYWKPVREGAVTCARVQGTRAVFGIADVVSGGFPYREFYIEQSSEGLRLTELADYESGPPEHCFSAMPSLGYGGLAQSGQASFV